VTWWQSLTPKDRAAVKTYVDLLREQSPFCADYFDIRYEQLLRIMLGAGLVAGALGGFFLYDANSKYDDYVAFDGTDAAVHQDNFSSVEQSQTIGMSLAGTGAVLCAISGYSFLKRSE